jgi:CubicO group peptidase (beta-lactamase class C family)
MIIARIARMPKVKSGAIAIAAVLACLSLLSPAAATLPTIPASGRVALGAFLRQTIADAVVPAVAVIVVNREQQLFLDAAGKRDVAKRADLTPDAIFRIASMTKPITSLAVMMLLEEGTIGLDDPVTKYLPEFERVRVMTTFNDADRTFESRPPARPITVRHLLTHTSGIAYAFADARLNKIDDGRKAEVDMPLLHDPGERFTYGPNTAVLGSVIEKVTGQKLDAFLRARIFDPVGMRDTAYVVPVDKHARVVTQHARVAGLFTERPNPDTLQSPARGDGGLFSTATDYGRFMQVFLNGGRAGGTRLVSEASLRVMTSNQIAPLVVQEQPSADAMLAKPFPFGGGKDTFGFGFQIEMPPAGLRTEDRGWRSVGSYSWGGIYNTHFWIDPQQQIAVAVLMQVLPYYDDAAITVLRGVERLVYQHLRVSS